MPIIIINPGETPIGPAVSIDPIMIRDALLSIPEAERGFIITNTDNNGHKIYSIRRNAAGNPEYDYEL